MYAKLLIVCSVVISVFGVDVISYERDEGCAASTLVLTRQGYVPIATLKKNHQILSYDDENKAYAHSALIDRQWVPVARWVELETAYGVERVAVHQKVFAINSAQWVSADECVRGMYVACATSPYGVLVTNVKYQEASDVFVQIGLSDPHTYCIGMGGIITHNIVPCAAVTIGWAFGAGAPEFFWGVSAGLSYCVGGLAYYLGYTGSTHNEGQVVSGYGDIADHQRIDEYRVDHTPQDTASSQREALPSSNIHDQKGCGDSTPKAPDRPIGCGDTQPKNTPTHSGGCGNTAPQGPIVTACPGGIEPYDWRDGLLITPIYEGPSKESICMQYREEKKPKQEKIPDRSWAPGQTRNPNEYIPTYEHGKAGKIEYHHPNSAGRKSPCPIDGQRVLDNSLEVRSERDIKRRVGVEGDNIVVFQVTSQEEYHGHVRTWEQLESEGSAGQRIKNALIEGGLFTSAGKPIKQEINK